MPVYNEDIASVFDEMADLLEIESANPFRVRAYRSAARTVRGLSRELSELIEQGEDLTKLPTIGKDLAAKINEMISTGKVLALDKLHREVPASLEELLKIPGLGPKRVHALYHELGIKTLAQLERAAKKGRLRDLPGFGTRTEQQVKDTIASHRQKKRHFTRNIAMERGEPLLRYLQLDKHVRQAVIAGSYRRGKETVGDLDILASSTDPEPVMDRFVRYADIREVISKGSTRTSVILGCGMQVDLRVVEDDQFGAALHYFTGSKAHNIQIRRLGQQAGLKINEYGVFRGTERIAGGTEQSVFKAVGLPYIPPELRRGHHEIQAARDKQLPRLVELKDIKGDLHVHTNASDGFADMQTMVLAARDYGLKYLAITDHSRHLTVAHGLDPKRLLQQLDQIDRLNDEIKGITILKGIEVDILEDGKLDLPNNVLAKLDLVIGAVHSQFRLSRDKQTERILRAMDNRYFSILAHPTGRLLEERRPYNVDVEVLINMARERKCFMELNSQPLRLDLTDIYCEMARSAGVLVSIDSDSHNERGFDNLQFGISQARRGWLEKADVLNTRSLAALRKLLKETML